MLGMGIGMAPAAGPISGLTKDRLTVYRVPMPRPDRGEEHIKRSIINNKIWDLATHTKPFHFSIRSS